MVSVVVGAEKSALVGPLVVVHVTLRGPGAPSSELTARSLSLLLRLVMITGRPAGLVIVTLGGCGTGVENSPTTEQL